jgi:hypothetical protein
MNIRNLVTVVAVIGLGLGGLVAANALAQDEPAGLPDLVGALKASPGCLGVELAQTRSGKNVIFAWFEDKRAALRWYHTEAHQQVMDRFFPDHDQGEYRQPLADIPDDIGPIMTVASLTMSDRSHFLETTLPISQISIELYTPISGGVSLGGRFAPDSLKIPKTHAATPALNRDE